jgi:hypothetical protein
VIDKAFQSKVLALTRCMKVSCWFDSVSSSTVKVTATPALLRLKTSLRMVCFDVCRLVSGQAAQIIGVASLLDMNTCWLSTRSENF